MFKRIKKISDAFDDSISKLSKNELRKLIRECQNLTTTNCWFLNYDLKNIVIDRAKAFLESRRNKRSKKVGA